MMIMRSEKHSIQKYKKKRFFETLLSIAILLAIFLGGVVGYYGSKVVTFLDDISESTPEDDPDILRNTQQLENLEPFSVLVLGTDVEDGGVARSDSIVVVTVNPHSRDMKMVSIPRDTLITLPNGTIEKINAAYATGGARLARETVSNYLGIPIDYYASLDFNGLIELVDAVDGIEVNSELEFTESNYRNPKNPIHIRKGRQTLDGDEALAYARMRKKDPRGDFGRQDRQKEVIAAVLGKLASIRSITNLTNILNSISPYLKTNATSSQMIGMAANYYRALRSIEQLQLEGVDDTVYFPHYGLNVYVWEAYGESIAEIQAELLDHLQNKSKLNADETEKKSVSPASSDEFPVE